MTGAAVGGPGVLPMRDYQAEGVDAIERALGRGVRRPAAVLATGLGKTVMFSHIAQRWLQHQHQAGRAPGLDRVLVLAHRTELITQAASKIKSVAPGLRVGVVQAGRNETLSDVVVASVQTLAGERRRRMLRNVGLIVVDECHHATAPTYRKILQEYGALPGGECAGVREGGASAVGFTATMTRGDKSALGSVWQDVVFTRDYAFGVANGWLVRPRCVYVKVDDLDLSRVKTSRGDYQAADLGEAIEASLAPEAIVKAMREHAPDRPTILFAPLVSTAELIRDELRANGFTAEVVSANTSADDRRRILDDYRARRVQVLCNAMIFTEGTDLPLTSCIVVARPTRNRGLFIQMVGRGGRPDVGKTDLVVLDVVGASLRNSLTLPVELFGEGETERTEREPCSCDPGVWVPEVCRCGTRACLPDCMCGGASAYGCGCPRPEVIEGEQVDFADIGVDLLDPSWANGALVHEEIDLFHGSHNAWMRTRAGVWFLGTGERYLVLVPGVPGEWGGPGGYDVWALGRYPGSGARCLVPGVQELSYAMAWAEGAVTPAERHIVSRERSWRAKRPTPAQRQRAARWGIAIEPGMLSGEVSSRIEVMEASWRIDPGLAPYMIGR